MSYILSRGISTVNTVQRPAEVMPLSVAGRVQERLTWDAQQFEHFTESVICCAWVWYCYVTELHANDFIIKGFVIKGGIFCAGPCIFPLTCLQ